MAQEIHFVSGKGGTGKSLMAAGLALREARRGRKTLLVELGERSFYKDFFGLPEVGYRPSRLADGLDVALWNGTESLREYARHLIKVEALVRLFFDNPVSRGLIDVAPGLPELAVLGKITSGPRRHGPPVPYDTLVVDAYATGHFLNLLRAPSGMATAVKFGPMGEQSRSIAAVLRDPAVSRFHVVALPEETPVDETVELVEKLRGEFGLAPDVILNKTWEVPASAAASEHPFAKALALGERRQAEARRRFGALNVGTREVPQIFSEDPRLLLDVVAGSLS